MGIGNEDGEDTLLRGYDKVHLKLGSHGLFLLKQDDQWPPTVSLLVKAGLQHKELCAVFSTQSKIDFLSRSFKAGNDLKYFPFPKSASSSKTIFDSIHASIQQLILNAHETRHTGVRAVVDMSGLLQKTQPEKVMEFERTMEELLSSNEFPLTLICTYDLRAAEGVLTISLLDIHPHVIYESVEEEPPFFARIAKRLFKDPITKLPNVRYLNERLEEEMDRTRRYGGAFTVVLADIDRFQAINDTFGYVRGDKVLLDTAKILKDTLRKVDLVCRHGDDSFIMLLPETSKEGAQIISKRIQQAAGKIKLKNMEFSLSVGTATYPDDAKTKEALLQKAAKALKSSKGRSLKLAVS